MTKGTGEASVEQSIPAILRGITGNLERAKQIEERDSRLTEVIRDKERNVQYAREDALGNYLATAYYLVKSLFGAQTPISRHQNAKAELSAQTATIREVLLENVQACETLANTDLESLARVPNQPSSEHQGLASYLLHKDHGSSISSVRESLAKYVAQLKTRRASLASNAPVGSLSSNGSSDAFVDSYQLENVYRGLVQELDKQRDTLPREDYQAVIEALNSGRISLNQAHSVLSERHEWKDKSESVNWNQLVAVHKTNHLPRGKMQPHGHVVSDITYTGPDRKSKIRAHSARGTVHFTLNHGVQDHGMANSETGKPQNSWSDRRYAVLIPADKMKDRIVYLLPADTMIFGEMALPEGSEVILASKVKKHLTDRRLGVIREKTGASILTVGEEGESLDKTIERRIYERGYTLRETDNVMFTHVAADGCGYYYAKLDDLHTAQLSALAKNSSIKENSPYNSPFGVLEREVESKLRVALHPAGAGVYQGHHLVNLVRLANTQLSSIRGEFNRALCPEEEAELARIHEVITPLTERTLAVFGKENETVVAD